MTEHETETRDHRLTKAQSDRSRWTALYVLCAGVLMIVLDVTVVNVALPAIPSDLGFSESSLAWVVNGYLIAFGGLLLLAGRLGDLISRGTDVLNATWGLLDRAPKGRDEGPIVDGWPRRHDEYEDAAAETAAS